MCETAKTEDEHSPHWQSQLKPGGLGGEGGKPLGEAEEPVDRVWSQEPHISAEMGTQPSRDNAPQPTWFLLGSLAAKQQQANSTGPS